jgi:hypothetical protein
MQQRRSPFSDLSSKRRRETDTDTQILLALDPVYGAKLLPTNYIPLFVRGNELNVRQRAGELARRPYGDVCPEWKDVEQTIPFKCPHKLLDYVVFSGKTPSEVRYYFRTAAGDRYLIERGHLAGLRRPAAKNKHQALIDIWKARLRHGLAASDLRFQPWPALLQRHRMPEATRRSDHPFRLYLGDQYILPDDAPFSLGNDGGGFFFLYEMDCNTEDLNYSDEKNTIEGKLMHYRDVMKARVPHRLYGLQEKPNPVRLIIETVNNARRQRIKKRILQILGGPCEWILLGVTENYPKLGKKPPVNAHSLTQIYQRAGLRTPEQ